MATDQKSESAPHGPIPKLIALLILAAIAPYLNVLRNGFVYDDLTQVLKNPYLVNFHHLREIFTTGAWSYLGREGVTNYYRPLMTFTYLLCYHAFGKIAFGYHLVSLALDVAVVAALFGLTLALFRRRDVAFLAALAFALEPVHTESVAWIAGITDVELTLFFLLAFWLFILCARSDGRRSEGAIAAMAACFVLALLSKEQALALPVLATVYEHAYREDHASTRWREKLARYGVLWLISAGYLLWRVRALGALAPVVRAARVTWPEALLSAPALIGQYVAKFFWPLHLSAFYVFHKSTSLLDPRVLAGIAALALLAAAFAVLWRRERAASFGIVWFLVTLAPALNARWMAANVFAERYLYLPSAGLCWALGWGAAELWRSRVTRRARGKALLISCFTIVIAVASVRIITRNRDWRDGMRLFERTLAQAPDAAPILNNLGVLYWSRGEARDAHIEWQRAIEAQPDLVPALDNLALYYAREGDYARAVAYDERAAKLNPAFVPAHLHLGMADRALGLWQDAGEQYRAAVLLSPLSTEARNDLGEFDLSRGLYAEAEREFKASVEIEPNLEALDSLAQIESRDGRRDDARAAYQRALELNPLDSSAHFGLGAIEAAMGQGNLAAKDYEAGLETDPRNEAARAALRKLRARDSHADKPEPQEP